MTPAAFWSNELRARIAQRGNQARLNAEEINAVVMLIQKMKADGTADTDPEFLQLVELLRIYTAFQQQQQQQHMAMIGAAARQPPPSGPVAPAMPAVPLTNDQLNQLKYQIAAFKYISKNAPMPPALQHALSSMVSKPPSSSLSSMAAGGVPQRDENDGDIQQKVVEAAFGHAVAAEEASSTTLAANSQPESVRRSHADPYAELSPASPYSVHRVLVPSVMPVGLDPIALAQERERRIRNKIAYRIAELESLPGNLAQDSNSTDGAVPLSADKVKALVELKSLRLLEKQKQLRAQMVSSMKRSTTLATAVSRSDYRRVKKPSLREIRQTEKLERQQRIERERKEKQKQLDHLNNIIQHGRDMLTARKQLSQKQLKLGRAILHWHTNIEKEEQKLQERLTRERIRALKEDDEEAYLKLIDKQKDTRLTHLLQQTGQYLDTLASLVMEQQADIRSREGANEALAQAADGEEEDKVDYFHIAHRISEKVTAQANILVGGKLKEYQLKGLEWMVSLYNNKLNGILADEMGLGKTIQTISLITYLIEKKNQNGPFLVIVPLSTITNWTLEFEKWAPSVVKVVYKGTPNQRRFIQTTEMRNGTFNVLLTTYEYIIKDKAFLSKFSWIHTIIDEGHRMKNANSKLAITLTQFYSSRYRLILTGTPLQNNLPELWALLNFTLPKVFNSVKSFDEWFNTPFANTGEKIELNEEEQLLIIKRLHKVLRPFLLRRLKKDVEKDLPDKTELVIKTRLSSLQQKLYNQIRTSGAMLTGGEGKKGVRSINNTIMQLRKVCNHPFVFDEVENTLNPNQVTDDLIIRVSGKFELLDRMLEKLKATGHRSLIFFQMTAVMTIFEDFLSLRGHKYLRLDGSTKTDDRSVMLKQFNAPDSEYTTFILSTRAGGLGLNLQTADTVIIFDSDWNPHQDLQAQDRAHRIGQTKEVRIYRLISANSIEENILARAQYKLDIDGKVIQAGKFDNKSTNEEREEYLRSLLQANPEEDEGVNEADDDDDLNEILARNEEEMEVLRRIDKKRKEQDERKWKAMGFTGQPQRLISLAELPDVFLHDAVPEKEESTEEMGRGRRAKEEVRYDDGLTEEQWTKAIDNDEDINDIMERKRQRREKRASKIQQNAAEGDETTATPKRSRGGKSKGRTVNDEDAEDAEEESEEANGRRKKVKVDARAEETSSSSPPSDALREIMVAAFDTIRGSIVRLEDGSERSRCELFLSLPSKKLYPDYYALIKEPIAMDMIQERMDRGEYHTIEQFVRDFHLMFRNAMTYNADGSMVYEDAKVMKQKFDEVIASTKEQP